MVHEAHVRRGLIEAGERLIDSAYTDHDQTSGELLADHSAILDVLLEARRTGRGGMLDDAFFEH